MLEGFKAHGGRDTRDRSISERDILRLPVSSVERNQTTGDVTRIIRQGRSSEGDLVKVTETYTYDASQNLKSIARTYEGVGNTFTETETISRDDKGDLANTSIAFS